MSISSLNVVLIEPEIPQNTGNIGRTCVGWAATLHLVGSLGFSLEHKHVKRAGLDYWEKLRLRRHPDWPAFLSALPEKARLYFISTKGRRSIWQVRYRAPAFLVFGSESRGFPSSFYKLYEQALLRIPVTAGVRSLNLATAVGISVGEVVRQNERR